jgi:probable F420-dependent oxidoreductase
MSAQTKILQNHDVLAETARKAEALGYEELYVPDHFGSVDPFIAVMVAAEATTTLRVGTLVLNNEFHHTALLARTAATIDRHTGGRFILGCGTGYMQSEHDATGIPLRAPKERVDRFAESMAALRELLDVESATMLGEHVQITDAKLGVRPIQARLPILIGGHGRRVVGIAAKHADIYQFTGLIHGPGGAPGCGGFAMSEVVQRRDWLVEGAGDRIDDIERSTLVQYTSISDASNATGIDVTAMAAEFEISEDTFHETPFILAGSTEQIIDKLERLRAQLGISHIVVRDVEGFAPIVVALAGR